MCMYIWFQIQDLMISLALVFFNVSMYFMVLKKSYKLQTKSFQNSGEKTNLNNSFIKPGLKLNEHAI